MRQSQRSSQFMQISSVERNNVKRMKEPKYTKIKQMHYLLLFVTRDEITNKKSYCLTRSLHSKYVSNNHKETIFRHN